MFSKREGLGRFPRRGGGGEVVEVGKDSRVMVRTHLGEAVENVRRPGT